MKKIILLSLFLILSACDPGKITQTTVIDKQVLEPNLPRPTTLQPINWSVYEVQTLDPSQKNNTTLLFTLPQDQFQLLGDNLADMEREILQLKEVVIYYQSINSNIINRFKN